jgi:DNA-binding IclR family transcriptional regulator
VRLARAADPDRALVAVGRPVLEELAATTGESTALAVPRPGPAMDVIAQADAPGLLAVSDWVGRHFPLHASAPGKLVLAELDDSQLTQWVERAHPQRLTPQTITTVGGLRAELATIRAQGYAELHDELEPALASLAVTVRGTRDQALAFVGVSGPSARLDAPRRRALVGPVRAAAKRIARAAAEQR